MEKVRPHTLSGFMELLPAPQAQMERSSSSCASKTFRLRPHRTKRGATRPFLSNLLPAHASMAPTTRNTNVITKKIARSFQIYRSHRS